MSVGANRLAAPNRNAYSFDRYWPCRPRRSPVRARLLAVGGRCLSRWVLVPIAGCGGGVVFPVAGELLRPPRCALGGLPCQLRAPGRYGDAARVGMSDASPTPVIVS